MNSLLDDLERPNSNQPLAAAGIKHSEGSQPSMSSEHLSAACIGLFSAILSTRDDPQWASQLIPAIRAVEAAAKAQSLRSLVYVCNLLNSALVKQARKLPAPGAALQSQADFDKLLEWSDQLTAFSTGRIHASEAPRLVQNLQTLSWFIPTPASFQEMIEQRLVLDYHQLESNFVLVEAAPDQDDQLREPEPAQVSASPPEPEVLLFRFDLGAVQNQESGAVDEFELLAEAFEQSAQEFSESALQLGSVADHPQAWTELADELRDKFQAASNAACFMQVESMRQALAAWEAQFARLIGPPCLLQDHHIGLMSLAPRLWADFCRAPSRDSVEPIMDLLSESAWPLRVRSAEVSAIKERLVKIKLIASRQVQTRSEAFSAEDLSLAIPHDAEPSVVDNLLRELPSLSTEFSQLIAQLCAGQLSAVEPAQRIAHTLKGSANTVGVRGVANLTHQLEDILVIIHRDQVKVSGSLAEFLSEAADCLEEMSECVAGMGGEPADAAGVYARAITWANQLVTGTPAPEPTKETGASEVADAVAAKSETAANPETAETPEGAQAAEIMLRVPASLMDKLLRIVGESSVLLGKVQNEVETINQTQRTVGDTASRLEELSHELDRMVDSRSGLLRGRRRQQQGADNFDDLELDEYNEMHTMARRFAEIGLDNRVLDSQLRSNVQNLANIAAQMERMQAQTRDLVLQTRMVPVSNISPRLQRAVRQAARLTGKTVRLLIDGEQTMIDGETLNRLVDPLMHLLRNAVDHGIEDKAVRLARGKHEIGEILLSFSRDAGQLMVRCQDNGAGLDLDKIYEKAQRKGLTPSGQELSKQQIADLILLPGFSTRDQATQLSGRGIGLDVVAQLVRDMKGGIQISTEPGQGTAFEITLPLSFSSMPVMVASGPEFSLALSLRGIEQIAAVSGLQSQDGESSIQLGDQRVVCFYLEDLVNFPRSAIELTERVAMVVKTGRGAEAVLVPRLSQARNIIAKPLSRWIAKRPGIEGVAALGDGSAAAICDLPELLAARFQQKQAGTPLPHTLSSAPQLPLCLVVDDSVSVRRSMESFVSDLGFDAVGARDGIEALGVLERRTPSLIIIDFEMPRMNGVELTANIRNNSPFRDVPIIMITSRSSEKHKATALEAGVNSYMTKPYTEDDLAAQIYALAGQHVQSR